MVDEPVIATVRSYLEAIERAGVRVSFGVVFGSSARGTSGQWSDIDLVVVSTRFDGPRRREDIALLWRTAARVDSRIEPIACGEQQWVTDDSSAVIEIARRDGQRVSLPEAA